MKLDSTWLRSFLPEQTPVSLTGRAVSAAAAALAGLAVAYLSTRVLVGPLPIIAALGASACLVFCLPAAPLSQPWSVVGCYLVCALAGVVGAKTGWPIPFAAALAIGLGVFGMLLLRCLHPPGGAVALFAVIGGDKVASLGWSYVVVPVLANAVLLVAVALIVNNLLPGRHYPRRLTASHSHRRGFSGDDLHAALREYGHPLAVSEEELDAIVTLAERHARSPKSTP